MLHVVRPVKVLRSHLPSTLHHIAPITSLTCVRSLSDRQGLARTDLNGLSYKESSSLLGKSSRKQAHGNVRWLTIKRQVVKGRKKDDTRVSAYVGRLENLRTALESRNIRAVIEAYSGVRNTVELGSEDVHALARALHAQYRSTPKRNIRTPAELDTLANLLINDTRQKALPPSPRAYQRLLSFFKESQQLDKGFQFWTWLVQQDDTYVTPALYGCAIELMAVKGRPAEETEDLYMQALKRFPGNYDEYHLSPNAIVLNRSQPAEYRAFPFQLLQGIITARLHRGDIKNAYLGLDTALRLAPNGLPSRLFAIFIEERPVSEAYKVFQLACRSGTILSSDVVTVLLTRLRVIPLRNGPEDAVLPRAAIALLYAYVSIGGNLVQKHLVEASMNVLRIMEDRRLSDRDPMALKSITDGVMNAIKLMLSVFEKQGVRPPASVFNSIIIRVAGRGSRGDILIEILHDMQSSGLEPSAVTHRSVMVAAGALKDREALLTAWKNLKALKDASGIPLDAKDWLAFAPSAVECGWSDFLLTELDRLAHTVTPEIHNRVYGSVDAGPQKARTPPTSQIEDIYELIKALRSDVEILNDLVTINSPVNLLENPLPMSLGTLPDEMYNAELTQGLRQLYDELTTEPGTDQMGEVDQPPSSPAITPSGFPFDELRYRNWQTINELLAESEQYEYAFTHAAEKAMSQHRAPPKREDVWWDMFKSSGHAISAGLSDFVIPSRGSTINGRLTQSSEGASSAWQAIAQERKEILRLRGQDAQKA